MNVLLSIALICGMGLYAALLSSSLLLAVKAEHDPDIRFAGIVMSLFLIGGLCLILGLLQ